MIAGAIPFMLSIGLSQAGVDAPRSACEAAIRDRDEAFRSLAAELAKLHADDRRLGGVDGFPPLQMAGRYAEFQEKLKAFDRRYPYRDCAKKKAHVQHKASRHAELVSASSAPQSLSGFVDEWTLKQVQGDGGGMMT